MGYVVFKELPSKLKGSNPIKEYWIEAVRKDDTSSNI